MPAPKRAKQTKGNEPNFPGGVPALDTGSLTSNMSSTIARRIRGRKGVLESMPTMPLDVIGMKSAWSHVDGLPECPSFLSEPPYASLVFLTYCHNCLKQAQGPGRLFIQFAARYCKKCDNEQFVDEGNEDLVRLFDEIESVTGEQPPRTALGYALFRFANVGMASETTQQLGNSLLMSMRPLQRFSLMLNAWVYNKKSERKAQLREEKRSKVDAIEPSILERLRGMGWQDELDKSNPDLLPHSLGREPFARKSGVLTDRGWAKIEDQAVAWVEEQRDQRLWALRDKVLTPRFRLFAKFIRDWVSEGWPVDEDDDLPIPSTGCRFLDYVLMPEVQDVLDAPDDMTVTEQYLNQALKSQLPREELHMKLEEMPGPLPGGVELMYMATSLFDCASCEQQFMTYPEVLAHRCRPQWQDRSEVKNPLAWDAIAKSYARANSEW
ncbi:hypothetical protein LXA43DRAFT_1058168 [Ganoderma leucocontextum]|nr:hypothetical protein LXA43DRAFT_1058168 [Ganoderma leucocontextum]